MFSRRGKTTHSHGARCASPLRQPRIPSHKIRWLHALLRRVLMGSGGDSWLPIFRMVLGRSPRRQHELYESAASGCQAAALFLTTLTAYARIASSCGSPLCRTRQKEIGRPLDEYRGAVMAIVRATRNS